LDFRAFFTTEGFVSLVSLAALEIVLGIDNIVFIAIVSDRIEAARRPLLRRLGVGLALGLRLALLFTLSWMMGLTAPVVSWLGQSLSGRDLVLLAGGLFLIAKSSHELFLSSESHPAPGDGEGPSASAHTGAPSPGAARARPASAGVGGGRFGFLLVQILLLDVVFSLDSVITAVGMAQHLSIMAAAMVLAVLIMLLAANVVSDFISRHPSMKVLALSFLLMIGVLLLADAFGKHISKGYVYFAMAYALGVELINLRRRATAERSRADRSTEAPPSDGKTSQV
jgi:predicted tellurium resistance membrane protein TerC